MRTTTATYDCDALVFATGFDAMTGALTRIDPVGPAGEPRGDAARTRTDHVTEVAEGTLFPRAQSSWYLGANIDGKKRVFIGGFGVYRQNCDDVARRGYAGLVLTT